MDPRRICRLCSFEIQEFRNIFTTPGLLHRILECTDIKIRVGDGLPSSICDLCDLNLQFIAKFRDRVGEADKRIRALISRGAIELNETRRSAFQKPSFKQDEDYDRSITGFQPRPNRRSRIQRERMRLTERKPGRLSQVARLRRSSVKKSFIYSNESARSLVASYKAVISRCRTDGFMEEFALPSSFAFSDDESDPQDERASRFAAARRRLQEKHRAKNQHGENKSLKTFTRMVIDAEFDPAESVCQDSNASRFLADPLNLLKVKSVQPLVDDHSNSASFTYLPPTVNHPTTNQGFPEDQEDRTLTGNSSTKSAFSEESPRPRFSASSESRLKCNAEQLIRNFIITSSSTLATDDADDTAIKVPIPVQNQRSSTMKCPACDKTCANSRGLKVHFWTHWSENCRICEAPTATREQFKDHMQVHIIPLASELSFRCGVCRNFFRTNVGLRMHMRVHTKSAPAVKKCPHCAKSFDTQRGFAIHAAKAHSGFETE